MKLISWIFALCFFPALAMAGNENKCDKLPETYKISEPVTVAEIERDSLKDLPAMTKVRPDLPQVPFGFINHKWKKFKETIQPGDVLIRFMSDQKSWDDFAGREGMAVLRDGCVVETFDVVIN